MNKVDNLNLIKMLHNRDILKQLSIFNKRIRHQFDGYIIQ